jgi:hypothetical protein
MLADFSSPWHIPVRFMCGTILSAIQKPSGSGHIAKAFVVKALRCERTLRKKPIYKTKTGLAQRITRMSLRLKRQIIPSGTGNTYTRASTQAVFIIILKVTFLLKFTLKCNIWNPITSQPDMHRSCQTQQWCSRSMANHMRKEYTHVIQHNNVLPSERKLMAKGKSARVSSISCNPDMLLTCACAES